MGSWGGEGQSLDVEGKQNRLYAAPKLASLRLYDEGEAGSGSLPSFCSCFLWARGSNSMAALDAMMQAPYAGIRQRPASSIVVAQ